MTTMGHLGGYLPSLQAPRFGGWGAELAVEHVNTAREHCFIGS